MDPVEQARNDIEAILRGAEEDYTYEAVEGDAPLVDWESLIDAVSTVLETLKAEATHGN